MKSPLHAVIIIGVLVSLAAAQNGAVPAEIQNVNVGRSGGETNIAVTLTAPVTPNVIVATGPDRLVLELPNTTAAARQRHIPFSQDGVKGVRVGLNSADPPVTRVVVDLEQARLYKVSTNGNTVILTVLPDENAKERRGGPVPAASAPIWGRLKPQKKEPAPTAAADTNTQAAPIVPPKPFPPLQLPNEQNAANASAVAANPRPTAAHPNFGSLQQGTVYPTAGAPGSGYVPQASDATPGAMPGSAVAAASKPAASVTVSVAGNSGTATTVTTTVVAHVDSLKAPAASAAAQPAAEKQIPPFGRNDKEVGGRNDKELSSGRNDKGLTAPAAPIVPPAPVVTASLSGRNYPGLAQAAAPAPKPEPHVIAKASIPAAPASTVVGKNESRGAGESPAPTQPPAPVTVASAQPVPAAPVPAAQPAPTAPAPVAQPAPTTADAAAAPEPEEADPALAARQPNSDIRMGFKIKYVAAGAAYLEGGRNAGLSEGMKLQVRDNLSGAESGSNEAYGPAVAELDVLSVADTSTVAEIHDPKRDVKAGDWAYLSTGDTQSLVAQRSLSPTRKYPVVVSFTEGTDPLAEEAHAIVPRPPTPDINRAQGRFGFDYNTIMSQGMTSSSTGLSVRTDITRIGGTYWNMSGFWRGRLTRQSGSSQVQTLQDLINRTYHLALTYDNPEGHIVAGFGRLYLPYATSLETIDGGYAGYRIAPGTTLGVFAGSTPDPTAYSYNPNQEIGGTFVNFQGGDWQAFRYSDTFGMGIEMLKWKINRPFVFGENMLSYKRIWSLYSAVQADSPAGNAAVSAPGAGLSRSFTTFRVQPWERIEFDVNHTYFRDIPTFDPTLVGTGLLDKYLFQGFSGGTRIEVLKQVWLYTTIGKSSRTGDKSGSLNKMYGITFGRLPGKIRTDFHYSKFDSSFGSGTYYSGSVSRNFHENFMWEVLAGEQKYTSSVATADSSHFVTGNIEAPLGVHYYFQSGFTWNRGGTQNYNQMLFSFGYRFDTRHTTRGQ